MIFKVDFAKAYDLVRWDFFEEVLIAFGFGPKWCSWILGSLKFRKASVLVNGSSTFEFQFQCGLKQGLKLNNYVTISHLFYADDAVFVGDWSSSNLACIMNVLQCFSLTSGLKINVHKSHLLGVGVPDSIIVDAATSLGCSIMKTPFTYLGVSEPLLSTGCLSTRSLKPSSLQWKHVVGNFTEACDNEEKISWVKWSKVLSPKKHGGLGVSSFYALNRALLFKWVWRFISQGNSLWARVISSIHGSNFQDHALSHASLWTSIIREVQEEVWIGGMCLRKMFPRIFALENDKSCSVAIKLQDGIVTSLRCQARGS
nr:RNA-directed DNA polymerase, eukaryota, reverse transcriptase zinc-binding domain protein [Tanacetum cinerariifolium]